MGPLFRRNARPIAAKKGTAIIARLTFGLGLCGTASRKRLVIGYWNWLLVIPLRNGLLAFQDAGVVLARETLVRGVCRVCLARRVRVLLHVVKRQRGDRGAERRVQVRVLDP